MNKLTRFTPVLFLVAFALILSACNNPAARQPGVWYNPFSWGDRTAEQTAADILAEAQAQKTIADAKAQATAMAGGSAVEYPGASSAPELPAGDQLVSVCDFTTASAKEATGVDVQRIGTEACGWVWRAVDKASVNAVCPENMVCTFHLSNDKKVVVKGNGKSYSIVAGTFRIASAYPLDDAVRDVCRLLAKEQAFGAAEVPSFTVEAGNFSCP